MESSEIREAINRAVSYLSEHPTEAKYVDSAATAVLERGLQVRVTGPDGVVVTTDMPTSVGGGGGLPSPGWLLRAAQASCLATLIAMRAATNGQRLRRIEVVVDSESDDRGILGMDDSVPAGPLSSRARVRVEADGIPRKDLEALVRASDAHCPVQDAVRRAIPCTVELA